MVRYRTFNPGDPFPSDYPDALGDFLASLAHNFLLIIDPADPTRLQVPASAGDGQAAIAVNGRWRFNPATVSRVSPGGGARTLDVFVTASDNVFTASGGGEIDSTDYAFGLAIVNTGTTPSGVALSRKIGTAVWDGTRFTSVTPIVGAQAAGLPSHAATHLGGGSDALCPRVTALPTTGPSGYGPLIDGQECYFVADGANGVIWHLRYNAPSTSAYKWEYVGGPPLHISTLTPGVAVPLGVPAAVVPHVKLTLPTLPSGGDFDVEFGSQLHISTPTSGATVGDVWAANMALSLGGGAAVAFAVGRVGCTVFSAAVAAQAHGSAVQSLREIALTSAETIEVVFGYTLLSGSGVGLGSSGALDNAYLTVRPVRVG